MRRWWWVPGFLGDESHFGEALNSFPQSTLLSPLEFATSRSLADAAGALAGRARASGDRVHLVGYSLGGRLALQAALQAPEAFASVTAISAHPGFLKTADREARVTEDELWSERLLNDWEHFWTAWNQRAVLATSAVPARACPSTEELSHWAGILTNWSTGQQDYLPPHLTQVRVATQVIMGAADAAYVQHLKAYPETLKKVLIPEAGHRVALDRPSRLVKALQEFAQENS